MKHLLAMMPIAAAAQAHQVVHMRLDQVTGMVGVVYLARVDHVETTLYQNYGRVQFILTVLEAHGAVTVRMGSPRSSPLPPGAAR